MRHPHTGQAWQHRTAIALAAFMLPAMAVAGTVTVNEAQGKLSIDTTDAAVDEILAHVGQSQGFEIERIGPVPDEKISGNFAGSLADVAARILQNENHMIVHSATAKTGIARIVLLGPPAKTDAVASAAAPAVATPGRRTAGSSPQPLPREVIAPSGPTPAPQPVAKRPRS